MNTEYYKTIEKEPLYKIDSKNKVRIYDTKILNFNTENYAIIVTITGLLNGKKVVKETVISKGKNIGKSNSTTPFEQANSDLINTRKRKSANGYMTLKDLGIRYSLDDYTLNGIIFPKEMLESMILKVFPKEESIFPMKYAKYRLETYSKDSKEYKESKPLNFPVIVSPKLDGVNCWGDAKNGLSTRGGKLSLSNGGKSWNSLCPQIANALSILNYPYPLNGEVYKHGHTLREITDACKKETPLSSLLEFHIFDICVKNKKYEQRREDMLLLINSINFRGLQNIIKVVPSSVMYTTEELLKYETEKLVEDYEGIMVKSKDNLYKTDYRSRDALKLVRFDSMEVEIINIIPYEKEPDLGKFICILHNKEFKVDPGKGFDKNLKREILKNKSKYIGQLLTISHRGFTPYGIPRIAKGEGGGKAFRPKNDL